MDLYRIRHTIGMALKRTGRARAAYIRKHGIFRHMGRNCMVMFRKIPLYPRMISIGDNVWIASDVTLITHDVIHWMLNNREGREAFQENIGCIEIGDNVFIGANSTILPDVSIGSDTVVAAGSLVNRSIPGNGVYAGVPVKYICSFEEMVEKRRNAPRVRLDRHGKGGLSDQSVNAYWERFLEKERQNTLREPEKG